MRPEQQMWSVLRQELAPFGHFTRHEDLLVKGLPDVSFGIRGIQGWMELKCLRKWPVRPETIVLIPHFTAHQRAWLFQRGQHGSRTWLLIRINRDWLLFDYRTAAEGVGRKPALWLKKRAFKHWSDGLVVSELVDALIYPV